MKKILTGIIIGVVLGGAAAWCFLRDTNTGQVQAPPGEVGEPEPGLHLTKEQQAAAGLVIAKPQPAERAAEAKAFGRVLDATPLATLLTEIETADSTAAASAKEWERLKSLGENAAARTLESAEAAMRSDRAAAESAHGRLVAGWGKALADRADLASFTRGLLSQEIALARVDLLAGEMLEGMPVGVRVGPVTEKTPLKQAELIGPAPSTDPQAQGRAFLVLIHEQPPAPGTVLSVRLAAGGAAQKGFLLPRTAVVQHGSGMFVFVQTAGDRFERKEVATGPPQPGGVFVNGGVSAEDQIVMTGAQQLLSEEFKGAGSEE